MSDENQPIRAGISMPSHTANIKEEELDLLDVIYQVWRGKWIVFISIFVALIIAVLYLLVAKEKWTSETIISQPSAGQVATYNNALSILYTQNLGDKISLPDLQRQIFGRYAAAAYALSGTLKNLDEPLDLKVSQITKGKDDPLSISFTASTAEDAKEKLSFYINQLNREVADEFAIDMKNNIFVKTNGLKDSLAAQEKIAQDKKDHRIDVIKQAIKIADAAKISSTQLSQAEYLSDDTLYLLGTSALTSMIANEKTKPLELNDYYYETQRTLLALNKLRIDFTKLQNFQFIKKPDLPIHRDSPKRIMVLIIAILLGGIAGAFIVIGRNMTQSYNRKKRF
jgi:chain length determinant protein (polysaccharide antigen chain regulator)